MRIVPVAVVAFLCAMAPCFASAVPITFSFTGSVTDDPFGASSFGAPISGSFSFNSTAVDSIPGVSTGSYLSNGSPYRFDANVDGIAYSVVGSTTVNTANNIVGGDQYGVIGVGAGLTLELFLQDSTGTALSSDALLLLPPPLAGFSFRQFRLFSEDAQFLGSVSSLACITGCSVRAVPEPDTVFLLAIAAAVATLKLRRSRRRIVGR